MNATDVITTSRGRGGLRPGDALVVTTVTGQKKNRRRVQSTDGSTLTVRDWHWWDNLITARMYRFGKIVRNVLREILI